MVRYTCQISDCTGFIDVLKLDLKRLAQFKIGFLSS